MIEEIFKKTIKEFHYDIKLLSYNQKYDSEQISAYDIREQDYKRIMREKSGTCFNFSLYLNRYLDKLGIENRCAILETSSKNLTHMVVLYKQDNQILVGDLSNAILGIPKLQSEFGDNFNLDIMLRYFTSRTLLEYMGDEGWEKCLIVQAICDDGKQIQVVPFMFDAFYNSIHNNNNDGYQKHTNKASFLDEPISVTENEYIGSTTISFSKNGKVYRSYTDEKETVLQIKTEKDRYMRLMMDLEDYHIFMYELKSLDSSLLTKYKDIIDSLPEVFFKQMTKTYPDNIDGSNFLNDNFTDNKYKPL